MIAHVVLFEPRPGLDAAAIAAALSAVEAAAREIPSIRRLRVGRRVRHGLPGYEQVMATSYSYAAIVEFDDRRGLEDYLRHPAHAALDRLFNTGAERALAYDYDLVEGSNASSLEL